MSSEPRRPGQSNAEYENRTGASQRVSAKFLGTNSIRNGGDPGAIQTVVKALFSIPAKLRARKLAKSRKHSS